MKIIRKILIVLCSVLILASCDNTRSMQGEKPLKDTIKITMDSLMAHPERYKEKLVEVTGKCTHVCFRSGPKAFLVAGDTTRILKCVAMPQMKGKFGEECDGKVIKVTGILREEIIDIKSLSGLRELRASQLALISREGKLQKDDSVNLGTSHGCDTEKKFYNQGNLNTLDEEINDYRTRINDRIKKEGKNYLQFYHLDATGYK